MVERAFASLQKRAWALITRIVRVISATSMAARSPALKAFLGCKEALPLVGVVSVASVFGVYSFMRCAANHTEITINKANPFPFMSMADTSDRRLFAAKKPFDSTNGRA